MRSLLLTLGFLIVAVPAGAHEIGKTQASVAVQRGAATYTVDVIVDPDALLTKLEVFDGRLPAAPPDRTVRDQRIRELARVFAEHVRLEFDGRPSLPQVEYRPASALSDVAQEPSKVRLTGRLPPDARGFRFAYGLGLGSYALNVRIDDGPVQTVWLEGPAVSPSLSLVNPPLPLTSAEVAAQYVALGYTHILPKGLDHILFVVGIFLLSARWRSVVLQVSTFTLAHSITLALTMYGIIALPAKVVEPLIALSIAYVAIENLCTNELKPWRLALVFSFGLLHGMGFAGVLRDLGLPRHQFLTALVTFNAGVEAGQLSVITLAFLAVAAWRGRAEMYHRHVVRPASAAIAAAGLYWTVARALS